MDWFYSPHCTVAAACVAARMASLGSWRNVFYMFDDPEIYGGRNGLEHEHALRCCLDALSNMVSQCFTCPWSVASRNRSLPTAEDDITIHGRRCTKTLAPSSSHDRWCSSPDLVPYCYGYLWINTQRYPRDLAIAVIL